ncbi:hypothetical protein M3Y98_01229700 [Aphelenchoides besseyi]|nr:hypothetical protein M3Y98_01229700 [Aphelenchoides besseyi]
MDRSFELLPRLVESVQNSLHESFLETKSLSDDEIRIVQGKEMTVSDCLNKVSARDNLEKVIDQLGKSKHDWLYIWLSVNFVISTLIVNQINFFRQRIEAFWHCNVHCIKADVYLFDQPSSYLMFDKRLEAAKAIRECSTSSKVDYVMVVEHDLAIEPQSPLDK